MPKIGNNPIMQGLSGMLGNVVVYRQQRGVMVMSNRPKKLDEPTDPSEDAGCKVQTGRSVCHPSDGDP